jgi:hypothetical protein
MFGGVLNAKEDLVVGISVAQVWACEDRHAYLDPRVECSATCPLKVRLRLEYDLVCLSRLWIRLFFDCVV